MTTTTTKRRRTIDDDGRLVFFEFDGRVRVFPLRRFGEDGSYGGRLKRWERLRLSEDKKRATLTFRNLDLTREEEDVDVEIVDPDESREVD